MKLNLGQHLLAGLGINPAQRPPSGVADVVELGTDNDSPADSLIARF